MRVIAGSAKGRRLSALPGLSTRPTASSVKEAVMSMIQFEIEGGRVADLFAGTGQLGIEALSRGAASCVFVDSNKDCRKIIFENLKSTELSDKGQIRIADVDHWIKTNRESYDIIFADPPYNQNILPKILPEIVGFLNDSGILVCESDKADDMPQTVGGFSVYKTKSYGKRKITVYRRP